ncbi:acyl-CoA-binding domain-containing protein 5-B isoform X2 [Misgurnus anguillicaudatus]|uniref:acyl-CoA-binding domain-containing protein 5-B isoform X2 n=1 Tax=Misgurnus anguillicaudatus TaxID=75329 RepID=UPI003CCF8A54
MDDPKSVQRRFEAAVKVIRSLPGDGAYELSDDMILMLYSYYKQATAGPCNTIKPNSWDSINKAKWEAWKALGNMSKDQAMMEYVQEIQLIIETLPVTDGMADLMDALDPFYEIVEEDEAVSSKPAPLSTGSINDDEDDDDDAASEEEDESDSSYEHIEDEVEMVDADLRTLAEAGGRLPMLNVSEEMSVSSLTSETHSSLNTEEQEEELVYGLEPSTEPLEFCSSENSHSDEDILTKYKSQTDESDNEMHSDSKEHPTKPEKGSGVPRVHLADISVAGANIQEQQGGNREAQCGSQDGKPQGVTPPVPHPPAIGTVQTDRMSVSRGRDGTNTPAEQDNLTEHSCQGDGECWEMGASKDRQAFNTQIAMALSQLEDNMQDVLKRLTILEVLTASQAKSIPGWPIKSQNKRLPRWPLDLSPTSVVLAVMWPFAVHWLVQFYLQKRRIWLTYNPVK